MSVTHDDVRHVAALARLAVDENKLDALTSELNGILVHMDALSQVDTGRVEQTTPSSESTPLRADSSVPIPLRRPLESFAPSMKDGFILVPRLATHDDGTDASS
jgi:aspartyl-tRNA(Asn)/glutamyl-tRNA(Gln) amidotransferase subunit C